MAYRAQKAGVLLFMFGGKVQAEEEFNKRVKARFGKSYQTAWKEATSYVNGFDKDVLLSADDFYRIVYRPARDELADKWSEAAEGAT